MPCVSIGPSAFLKRKGLLSRNLGHFANRAFEAGETIGEYTGKHITRKEADLQDDHSYQFNVRRCDTVIDAISSDCPLKYTNSADFDTEQNCEFVQRQFRIFLVTTKDVKEGVELLAYYNHD